MQRMITPSITLSIRRLFSPPRAGQVTNGSRDIDPRPINVINIKYVFFSFVCSRCQVGFEGIRVMGACITNKYIFWHTLLPQIKMCFVFSIISCIVSPNTGSRDIDPGSTRTSQEHLFQLDAFGAWDIGPRLKIFSSTSSEFPSIRRCSPPEPMDKWRMDPDTLASYLTIKGKSQH